MKTTRGNNLILGQLTGRQGFLGFSRAERDKHLYVCGGTGTGKSKFLENCIRQDIKNWHRSRSGMLVLDPHGSLLETRWGGMKLQICLRAVNSKDQSRPFIISLWDGCEALK